MAWVAQGIHIGRTDKDYKHLFKLLENYKNKPPPISLLKKACLKDGYPKEQVENFGYQKVENPFDDLKILTKKMKTVVLNDDKENLDNNNKEEPNDVDDTELGSKDPEFTEKELDQFAQSDSDTDSVNLDDHEF